MATGQIGRWMGVLALVFAPLVVGCELFTDLDEIEPQCRPDTTETCVCPDGTLGVQRCKASGRFEQCRCGDAGESGDLDAGPSGDGSG